MLSVSGEGCALQDREGLVCAAQLPPAWAPGFSLAVSRVISWVLTEDPRKGVHGWASEILTFLQ